MTLIINSDSPEVGVAYRGIMGPPGPSTDITMGTTGTLAPGLSATAAITGDAPNLVLNLGIPRGAKVLFGEGAPGTPGSLTALDGDLYFRANGQVYQVQSSEWASVVNLLGPQGQTPELSVDSETNTIRWRYVGGDEWTPLLSIPSLGQLTVLRDETVDAAGSVAATKAELEAALGRVKVSDDDTTYGRLIDKIRKSDGSAFDVTDDEGAKTIQLPEMGDYYLELTESGDWSPPEGAKWVYVELLGGGGSGRASTASSSGAQTASGGGGGQFNSKLCRVADLSAPVACVVGAGGAALDVSGNSNGNSDGEAGGDTSFGDIIAAGGDGGVSNMSGDNQRLDTGGWFTCLHGGGLSFDLLSSKKGGGAGASVTTNAVGTHQSGIAEEAGRGGFSVAASDADAVAFDGEAPGGGGGSAAVNNRTASRTVTSGAGADGVIRIWAW